MRSSRPLLPLACDDVIGGWVRPPSAASKLRGNGRPMSSRAKSGGTVGGEHLLNLPTSAAAAATPLSTPLLDPQSMAHLFMSLALANAEDLDLDV